MSPKIALLIDAENIPYKDLPCILEEVPRYGQIVLKAVYGDWQIPALQKWHDIAVANNFEIRHHANGTKTKNSADIKLIMDAMEVLYTTSVDIFCLVSNDADYVPLCDKIHESKKSVIGIGYQHAAEAFIRACDKFIFIGRGEASIQSLAPLLVEASISLPKQSTPPAASPLKPPDIRKLLSKAFAKAPQDANCWVILTALGQTLIKVQPDFKTTNYGHAKLSLLLEAMPDFVELSASGKSVRLKNNTASKQPQLRDIRELLSDAFAQAPQDANQWVLLTALGQALSKLKSSFKTNSYGHANLTKLLKNMPDFVEMRGKGALVSARLKNNLTDY